MDYSLTRRIDAGRSAYRRRGRWVAWPGPRLGGVTALWLGYAGGRNASWKWSIPAGRESCGLVILHDIDFEQNPVTTPRI